MPSVPHAGRSLARLAAAALTRTRYRYRPAHRQRVSVADQDRQPAVGEDVAGDAAEHQLAQTGATVAAHDQEVGAGCGRGVEERRADRSALARHLAARAGGAPRFEILDQVDASAAVRQVFALSTWTAPAASMNGRAPATARAASALSFQAIATVRPMLGAPWSGTIRSGRPAPNRVASRTVPSSGGAFSSGRHSTVRSLTRAFLGIISSRRPVSSTQAADAAPAALGWSLIAAPDLPQAASNVARAAALRRSISASAAWVSWSITAGDTPSPITGIASRGSTRTNRPVRCAPKRCATPNAASRLRASLSAPKTGARMIRMLMMDALLALTRPKPSADRDLQPVYDTLGDGQLQPH